jgi:hypothetical protein
LFSFFRFLKSDLYDLLHCKKLNRRRYNSNQKINELRFNNESQSNQKLKRTIHFGHYNNKDRNQSKHISNKSLNIIMNKKYLSNKNFSVDAGAAATAAAVRFSIINKRKSTETSLMLHNTSSNENLKKKSLL